MTSNYKLYLKCPRNNNVGSKNVNHTKNNIKRVKHVC